MALQKWRWPHRQPPQQKFNQGEKEALTGNPEEA
jgi:hypothetical protein